MQNQRQADRFETVRLDRDRIAVFDPETGARIEGRIEDFPKPFR